VVGRYQVSSEFNLVKLRTDELKLSFLAYPEFETDPHPALRHALSIDLATGKARHTDYAGNANPPILHRKETFLAPGHPLQSQFEALTRAEEAAGLYDETATIGFKLNWERLLLSKGLAFEGHRLITPRHPRPAQPQPAPNQPPRTAHPLPAPEGHSTIAQRFNAGWDRRNGISPEGTAEPVEPSICTRHDPPVAIARHKTALTRYELSKPVKSLLEYGVLRNGMSFFDYGCGQGTDVKGPGGFFVPLVCERSARRDAIGVTDPSSGQNCRPGKGTSHPAPHPDPSRRDTRQYPLFVANSWATAAKVLVVTARARLPFHRRGASKGELSVCRRLARLGRSVRIPPV
jgi:hypothetical protein